MHRERGEVRGGGKGRGGEREEGRGKRGEGRGWVERGERGL